MKKIWVEELPLKPSSIFANLYLSIMGVNSDAPDFFTTIILN